MQICQSSAIDFTIGHKHLPQNDVEDISAPLGSPGVSLACIHRRTRLFVALKDASVHSLVDAGTLSADG